LRHDFIRSFSSAASWKSSRQPVRSPRWRESAASFSAARRPRYSDRRSRRRWRKNLHGSLFGGKAEDLMPVAISEGGIALDFMRVRENYWAAAIDMTASKLANVPAMAAPERNAVDRQFVDLAGKLDQDCASFVQLVRETIDPLTPTRQRLQELPGVVGALSRQLQQRIADDRVTVQPAAT